MSPTLRVALLSPFHTGSHAAWAEGYAMHSRHEVQVYSMKGKHWKWRMHGAALTLARRLRNASRPDVLLATDMLDLGTFLGLMRKGWGHIPAVVYFHENQLTYPWSPGDTDPSQQRDRHYAFTNYSSALSADEAWFNSDFHRGTFLEALPNFLRVMPDYRDLDLVDQLAVNSRTVPLGLAFPSMPQRLPIGETPVVLWNHRWEYDKGPAEFFEALFACQDAGIPFHLVALGESFGRQPDIFSKAKERLASHILHWGFVPDRATYWHWLQRADILPVTARHDFFGASTVEAMAAGVCPLLPNRLAYPEHLPPASRDEYLYQGSEELQQRLQAWLLAPYRPVSDLSTYVQRYTWPRQAPVYDDLLSRLVM